MSAGGAAGRRDFEDPVLGPNPSPHLEPTALYPTVGCRAVGPRLWAGFWAQNPEPEIRPAQGGCVTVFVPSCPERKKASKPAVSLQLAARCRSAKHDQQNPMQTAACRQQWCSVCQNYFPAQCCRKPHTDTENATRLNNPLDHFWSANRPTDPSEKCRWVSCRWRHLGHNPKLAGWLAGRLAGWLAGWLAG